MKTQCWSRSGKVKWRIDSRLMTLLTWITYDWAILALTPYERSFQGPKFWLEVPWPCTNDLVRKICLISMFLYSNYNENLYSFSIYSVWISYDRKFKLIIRITYVQFITWILLLIKRTWFFHFSRASIQIQNQFIYFNLHGWYRANGRHRVDTFGISCRQGEDLQDNRIINV